MTLTNKTKGMLVYTLSHAEVCNGSCLCTAQEYEQTAHDAKSGSRGVRVVQKLVPSSLYIPAGETVDVSAAVLSASKIQQAIQAKILVRKGS
jgi:hypothetical protein